MFAGSLNLIAKKQGRVVGFITGKKFQWFDGKRVWIDEIVVDGVHQGKGIGNHLWSAYETLLRKQGIICILGFCNPDAAAYQFHIKHGARPSRFRIIEKKL